MGRSASHIATVDPIRTFKVRRGLMACHVNQENYYGVVYKYLTKEKIKIKRRVKKNKKAIFLLNTEVEDMCLRKS